MKEDSAPKISVIVPVYKAEAYLHRCVDTLLAQTFPDFEILLIDDGSPDKSGELCDEYARKDCRVCVYHKENGGVSSARQYGIDHARGEYTIHADPDDWVESTMLEELYKRAKDEDADMVICDYYVDEKSETKYIVQQPSSCCNKLVRRVCYDRYNVTFPLDFSYCEDLFVNVCLLLNDIKVAYLPKAFYHYDQIVNPSSLVHRSPIFFFYYEKLLYERLVCMLPSDLFAKVYPYLLWRQARWVLICGKPYTHNFTEKFRDLKPCLSEMNIPFAHKFFLKVAFEFFPPVVHIFSKLWNYTHRR